jgi:hypothetical protein
MSLSHTYKHANTKTVLQKRMLAGQAEVDAKQREVIEQFLVERVFFFIYVLLPCALCARVLEKVKYLP